MYKILKSKNLQHQSGFSLTELAIVIVIIGLLTGGIAGGIKLRNAAELRSIITDVEGFRVAIENFEYKYDDLPGDMADAHDYWDDGADGVCGDYDECGGDADGHIETSSIADPLANENLRAWQHLSLAGLISGSYPGITSTGSWAKPSYNIPATKRNSGGYTFGPFDLYDITTPLMYHPGIMIVGAFDPAGTAFAHGPFFSPSEAYSIDKKTDDGVSNSGRTKGLFGVVGGFFQSTECVVSISSDTYDTTTDAPECILYFSR